MGYTRIIVVVVVLILMKLYEGEGSLLSDGDEIDGSPLLLDYYKEKCPFVEEIVVRVVAMAVLKDPRMAASLLRLHFHDCFVMVLSLSLS